MARSISIHPTLLPFTRPPTSTASSVPLASSSPATLPSAPWASSTVTANTSRLHMAAPQQSRDLSQQSEDAAAVADAQLKCGAMGDGGVRRQ
jgi:hypothetical protein